MSKSLGTVFDLKEIFERATDVIFRGTPADRVVALIADETNDGKILPNNLVALGVKTRDTTLDRLTEKLTISRTITQKVMREKVALLSQDAKTDAQFSGADSIVSIACPMSSGHTIWSEPNMMRLPNPASTIL